MPSTKPVPREALRPACTAPNDGRACAVSAMGEADASNKGSYTGLRSANGQPYHYPTTVCVRNTFVDLQMPGRDPSLEDFIKERHVRSCPASWGPSLNKMDEEVPPASSRTTDCDTASERSAIPSTPPPELEYEVSTDADDMAVGVFPGIATIPDGSARANFMPASCTFRRTLSDYRNSHDAPQPRFPTGTANLARRSPYPPGRIHSVEPVQASSHDRTGYSAEYATAAYQAPYTGYSSGVDIDSGLPVETGYEQKYANTYSTCYPRGYVANPDGYPPHVDCYGLPEMVGPVPQEGQAPQPQVLQLSAAIQPNMQPMMPGNSSSAVAAPIHGPPGEFGEAVIPTRGSLLHASGRCKPCAFVFTKGCENDFECPFCHLCDPGEKKKRRKEKLEARRVMRDLRQSLAFNGYARGRV